jgi:hypothetical protein
LMIAKGKPEKGKSGGERKGIKVGG